MLIKNCYDDPVACVIMCSDWVDAVIKSASQNQSSVVTSVLAMWLAVNFRSVLRRKPILLATVPPSFVAAIPDIRERNKSTRDSRHFWLFRSGNLLGLEHGPSPS